MNARLVEKDLPELTEATDRMANTFDKRPRSDDSFGIPAIPLNPARSKPS